MSSRFLQESAWAVLAAVLSFKSTLARDSIVCELSHDQMVQESDLVIGL